MNDRVKSLVLTYAIGLALFIVVVADSYQWSVEEANRVEFTATDQDYIFRVWDKDGVRIEILQHGYPKLEFAVLTPDDLLGFQTQANLEQYLDITNADSILGVYSCAVMPYVIMVDSLGNSRVVLKL